jgi:uncharacterized protein YbjT (DUF2867 family)
MNEQTNPRQVIAVIGATGAQGGGLVRAILSDPDSPFTVRAITRKPDSEKAEALAAAGAEVVAADLDDVESLTAAFSGAYGAFCITNFWEHFSPGKEHAQAANMAAAAKAAGVQHVIWSTLEDTRKWVPLEDSRMPTLMETYKVPHFDAKGASNELFVQQGLPVTFLYTSYYWENLIFFGMGPKPGPDGVLAITFPMGDKPLPGIAVEDIGKCAYGILKHPEKYIGKSVGIAGEHLRMADMAAALSSFFGREVRYNEISPETYRSFGFPGADDLGNMFQINRDFSEPFCAMRSLEESRALNPELKNFAQWLESYGHMLNIEG